MTDEIERIDWQAERDAMLAPAYFAVVCRGNTYMTMSNRGASAAERGRALMEQRGRKERGVSLWLR